jgi:hypothetical protein
MWRIDAVHTAQDASGNVFPDCHGSHSVNVCQPQLRQCCCRAVRPRGVVSSKSCVEVLVALACASSANSSAIVSRRGGRHRALVRSPVDGSCPSSGRVDLDRAGGWIDCAPCGDDAVPQLLIGAVAGWADGAAYRLGGLLDVRDKGDQRGEPWHRAAAAEAPPQQQKHSADCGVPRMVRNCRAMLAIQLSSRWMPWPSSRTALMWASSALRRRASPMLGSPVVVGKRRAVLRSGCLIGRPFRSTLLGGTLSG